MTLSRSFSVAALVAIAAFVMPANAGAGIEVTMNQAKIVKLARAADTIVIGNPAIADASVQDASTVVLTGKGFGVRLVRALAIGRAGHGLDFGAPVDAHRRRGLPDDRHLLVDDGAAVRVEHDQIGDAETLAG
ncbi:MAG: hypothetical protein E5W38_22690, partial [Mesorhizobium sp.]